MPSTTSQVIESFYWYVCQYIINNGGIVPGTLHCGPDNFMFNILPDNQFQIISWNYGFPKPVMADLQAMDNIQDTKNKLVADNMKQIQMAKKLAEIIGNKIGTPIILTSSDLYPLIQYL